MQIDKIEIKDWCIFENFEYEPKQKNYISGDNETGKSRFGSAITWVLNGTDIDGDTLQDVVPVHREQPLSPTVTLDLSVVDKKGITRPATIEKQYKAQFTRDKTFTGEHKTIYKLNGVEITQKKWQEWIKDNICDLEVFNMLSNIKVFTEKLKTTGKELVWQKQRRIVESLINDMPDEFEYVQTQEKYTLLQDGLLRHKTATDYLKAIKTEQSNLQKEIDEYPIKKETVENGIVDVELSIDKLSKAKASAKIMLDKLEKENQEYRDSQTTNTNLVIIDEKTKLEQEMRTLAQDYNNKIKEYNDKKSKLALNINSAKKSLETLKVKIESLLQSKKDIEKSSFVADKETVCSYCGSVISNEIAEQEFNDKKQCYLATISTNLKELIAEQKRVKTTNYDVDLATYKALVEPIEPKEIFELQTQIDDKLNQLAQIKPVENLENYKIDKSKLLEDIENIVKLKMAKNRNEEIETTLSVMAKEHRQKMKRKSHLQQLHDLCKDFIGERCDLLERKVNALFIGTGISFNLFKQIKTTGERAETFEIYFRNKEYKTQLSLSTKTIVSYMITQALQKAYNVSVPIVLDNMESVNFNEKTDTQTFILTRTEENCPKCAWKSGRKTVAGEWICGNCGEVWKKKLTVRGEQ